MDMGFKEGKVRVDEGCVLFAQWYATQVHPWYVVCGSKPTSFRISLPVTLQQQLSILLHTRAGSKSGFYTLFGLHSDKFSAWMFVSRLSLR